MRAQVLNKLQVAAVFRGANAVLAINFDSDSLTWGVNSQNLIKTVSAAGTAVLLGPDEDDARPMQPSWAAGPDYKPFLRVPAAPAAHGSASPARAD